MIRFSASNERANFVRRASRSSPFRSRKEIEDALRIPGITRVDVSLGDETVTVDHDATIASGRLVALLEQAGYGSKPRRGCCCG